MRERAPGEGLGLVLQAARSWDGRDQRVMRVEKGTRPGRSCGEDVWLQ